MFVVNVYFHSRDNFWGSWRGGGWIGFDIMWIVPFIYTVYTCSDSPSSSEFFFMTLPLVPLHFWDVLTFTFNIYYKL